MPSSASAALCWRSTSWRELVPVFIAPICKKTLDVWRATKEENTRPPRGLHAEVGQNRQYASVVVVRDGQIELGEDGVAVLADRLLGDEQAAGDRRVGPAFGHQSEHLTLARREPAHWLVLVTLGQQRRHHLGVQDRPTVGDPAYGVDELRHVGDPVLEEVADRPVATAQLLPGVQLFDVLREHQDR